MYNTIQWNTVQWNKFRNNPELHTLQLFTFSLFIRYKIYTNSWKWRGFIEWSYISNQSVGLLLMACRMATGNQVRHSWLLNYGNWYSTIFTTLTQIWGVSKHARALGIGDGTNLGPTNKWYNQYSTDTKRFHSGCSCRSAVWRWWNYNQCADMTTQKCVHNQLFSCWWHITDWQHTLCIYNVVIYLVKISTCGVHIPIRQW